ncbi:hypothetical protein NU219Hw_g7748t1 [Hortaea werneckii]
MLQTLTEFKRSSCINQSINEDLILITIKRGGIKLKITVQYENIENTVLGAEIKTEAERYIQHLESQFARRDFSQPIKTSLVDHILADCLPMILELAPHVGILNHSLQDLCQAVCHDLEVVGERGRLQARHKCSPFQEPLDDISPLPIQELPHDCQDIPEILASQICIEADGTAPIEWTTAGKVSMIDGRYAWFKPRDFGREEDFLRELRLLKVIKDTAYLEDHDVRYSQLLGVVTASFSNDLCAVVGLLISWIPPAPDGPHLKSQSARQIRNSHTKWRQQVTKAVSFLHDHGICWGDVNVCNIVIDNDLNAWVIDFGGSNNAEFVDDDFAETTEGDWQGIRRIFDEWVPQRISSASDLG